MGALIRAKDWTLTSLGPPAGWPQGLRTAIRLMLNTGHPVYIFWGAEGLCFYNDAYRPSLGSERHPGSLGRPAREVWTEIWPLIGPQLDQVTSGGGATWDENRLIPMTRDGVREDVYWTYSYSPIDDETAPSGIGGALALCHETTQQVLDARRLTESEERLQQALSSGRGVGTWDWNVPADRVVADERFARLYGVDPERARSGAPIAEFFAGIHPADLSGVEASVRIALSTGDRFSAEYRLVQPDGTSRWVLAEGRCILAPDGAPQRFPGVSFDITERKSAERRADTMIALTDGIRDIDDPAELAFAAAQILGETLGVSRVGYGVVDPRNETITIERDWNASGVRSLAGVLQFRDYGSYIEDLIRGETVAIADAFDDARTRETADALKAISAQALVNMPLTEQGGLVALLYLNHAAARPWPQEDLLLIREVAERTRTATERLRTSVALRDSEARLREANETLEAKVTSRTQELMAAEEALRQSQKMEAVGQLTGGIAHDFNNLLAGISGALELLDKRIGEGRLDAAARYIEGARQSTMRAASLTQRLLAFSRRQTLDPRATDVNRLVQGMEELIRHTAGPTIEVEVVGAIGLWSVLVDPHQLENALLNLCINARDAMPDGGRLTVETANKWLDPHAATARDLPPGQYISLCVTDTGTGMASDVVERAFDPFFTTKPLGQGTGLGLSMIYGFARQSGGQVRIYSEVDQGTTMCLYFPRHLGDVVEGPHKEAAVDFDGGDGETVLVVDDEEVVRMMIVDVLKDAGYHTLEAADGPSGLKWLQTDARVDLLITDVGLPGGMNGRQVADAARIHRPTLKVLFITGYAENAVIGNGHLDPGMQVITKPFAIEALGLKVREMIDG